jgi:hypothetical protein
MDQDSKTSEKSKNDQILKIISKIENRCKNTNFIAVFSEVFAKK